MTFARSIKEELVRLKTQEQENLAELAALIQLNGELVINKDGMLIIFKSLNHAITRRFFKLVKELYNAEMEIETQVNSFNKKELNVIVLTKTQEIALELGLLSEGTDDYELLTPSIETKQAYLRGAFLSSGSINDPVTANYHMEIYANSKDNAIYIQRVANEFSLNSKITKRRNGFIVYLKEAEAISEFLKIIGAYEGVFKFEDLRIQRDFTNSINRVMNIEIANEKKTLKAADSQLNQIKFIKKHRDINLLEPSLRETIILREENPKASLNELSLAYQQKTGDKMSKSGINHRLLKIKDLAFEIAKSLLEYEEDNNKIV